MTLDQLPAVEQELAAAVSGDELLRYTTTIAQWVRLSGSEDEARAFDFVADTCAGFGMTVRRYAAPALVSWPGPASLDVLGAEPRSFPCITHSFAVSTPPGGIEGAVVDGATTPASEWRGKIVLSDGLANPGKGMAAEEAGMLAQININDDYVHEMIISPVWGTPTPETAQLLPNLISISVNARDGAELRRLAAAGSLRVRLTTEVDTRWRDIPVLTAEIAGREDRFVLFSGHIDSWHYGAMDNGTANATMLEVGRLLSQRAGELRRGLRLAFWSGHSHARYAGSAWYADHCWADLHERCVAHVNVDSVGGIGATILSEANAMAETVAFAGRAIAEVAGQELEYKRFGRAGDQSFNGIGLPSLFMSLSGQPAAGGAVEEQMARLLGTGGRGRSGGLGWWWHTTEDTLDKIDRDFLVRDATIYALNCWRLCTVPVLPFDYSAAVAEMLEVLRELASLATPQVDLGAVVAEAEALLTATYALNRAAERAQDEATIARLNACIMALGRLLTPINYTAKGAYEHDLALPAAPVPSLQPARQLAALDPASDEAHFLATQLVRASNCVWHAFRSGRRAIEGAAGRGLPMPPTLTRRAFAGLLTLGAVGALASADGLAPDRARPLPIAVNDADTARYLRALTDVPDPAWTHLAISAAILDPGPGALRALFDRLPASGVRTDALAWTYRADADRIGALLARIERLYAALLPPDQFRRYGAQLRTERARLASGGQVDYPGLAHLVTLVNRDQGLIARPELADLALVREHRRDPLRQQRDVAALLSERRERRTLAAVFRTTAARLLRGAATATFATAAGPLTLLADLGQPAGNPPVTFQAIPTRLPDLEDATIDGQLTYFTAGDWLGLEPPAPPDRWADRLPAAQRADAPANALSPRLSRRQLLDPGHASRILWASLQECRDLVAVVRSL